MTRASFDSIFEGELAYVWTSLRRLGVPERDIPDVTQELFVEVHRKLDHYDAARPIRPWLFAFAVRFASDYRRSARVRREAISDAEPEGAASSPEDHAEAARRRALVQRALEAIEEERRPVFVLHELDEVSGPEIADALGIPLNTVYSRLRLARDEFRAALSRAVKGGRS